MIGKKEKKNDCIFLGTLYQKDGKIKMDGDTNQVVDEYIKENS